jgi:AcrR family transcriptional regulator
MRVATSLFARQGYNGTTTRQIAERARVSEAIIFRHFPSKEELYWAILEDKCLARSGPEFLQAKIKAGLSDFELLAAIGREILGRDVTMSRLLLFSALENHRLSHRFFRSRVAQYYEVLAGFIRLGIRQGRFREVDPTLAARGYIGMLVYHFLVQELFGGKRLQSFDPGKVSETLASIWLNGMQRSHGNGDQSRPGTNGARLRLTGNRGARALNGRNGSRSGSVNGQKPQLKQSR